MIFLSFVDLKKASKQNFSYKLSSYKKKFISPNYKNLPCMDFSKSLQGNKWAISMRPVSI